MEGILARGLQVLIALAGAYVVALWFVLVVWTFRDIESRSRSIVTQVFSTLLVVLFFVPGILLYMILRPKATLDEAFQRSLEEEYLLQDLEELPLCHQCQRYVEDDFVLCPHCRAQLREPCQSCSRLVNLRWALCPYCAAPQDGRAAEEAARVEAPAARWTAPALRRRIRAVPDSALPEPIEPFVALATVHENDTPQEQAQEQVAIVTNDEERDETAVATAARPAPTRVRVHSLDRAAARRLDDAEPADVEDGDDEPATARLSVFHRARELGRAFTANGNGHSVGANGTAPKINGHRNGNGNGVANGRDISVLERLRLSATAESPTNGIAKPTDDEEAETEATYARSRAEGD